jgi:hypothetical protein
VLEEEHVGRLETTTFSVSLYVRSGKRARTRKGKRKLRNKENVSEREPG